MDHTLSKKQYATGDWRSAIALLHPMLLSLILAVIAGALFLGLAARTRGIGFPLDDAWIHQTYARNLATLREWAYRPGQPSSGSTAPLWTVLLAAGYILHIDYRLWTYGLGIGLLALTAWRSAHLSTRLFPTYPRLPWIVLGLTVSEWHLVWAATSGMETLLYACLTLVVLDLGLQPLADLQPPISNPQSPISNLQSPISNLQFLISNPLWPLSLALCSALLALTRPEGIVLFALAAAAGLLGRWLSGRSRVGLLADCLALGGGFGVVIAPVLFFNHQHGAGWLPNTFYAKQVEYAALLAQPFSTRLATVITPILAGPLAILSFTSLLPVFRTFTIVHPSSTRAPQYRMPFTHHTSRIMHYALRIMPYALPALWVSLTLLLYAWRLPVGYQHGRYILPVIPVLLTLGAGGLATWGWPKRVGTNLTRPAAATRRILRGVSAIATPVMALAFLVIGARAYATDVQFINTEMVETARWLQVNAPSTALVAAHDIGALGYFAGQPLLDLAGLISPEVVPYMRDETRLREHLREAGAEYAVFFPTWYPALAADPCFSPMFQGTGSWTQAVGGEHLVVYRTCWGK